MFQPLHDTCKLLQVASSHRRLHAEQSFQSERVVSKTVGRNEAAAPRDLFRVQDTLVRMQLEVVLSAHAEKFPCSGQ
jgi:hypothetical protein